MGVIRVLSDQIANQIAAGEVVERPASVVKELMENSLDAGARDIRIEVEAGGRKRIRIIDDGCGMVRDDALLAFERHATSKLRAIDDLEAIATLGFRGEALPSIAAVSRLTLETMWNPAAVRRGRAGGPAAAAPDVPDEPVTAGTRIQIAGGKLVKVAEAGLPAGTSITIEDLFFNVPARRKFLRGESTEMGHIATLVTHYALAYPDVRFHLQGSHTTLLSAPPASGHTERIAQIFGGELLEQLVDVADMAIWPTQPDSSDEPEDAPAADPNAPIVGRDADGEPVTEGLGIFGFISRPELQKINRNSIFIFVNRRLVRDRLIQHAVTEAYRNMLPTNSYPVVLLFLDLPYREVDVNVHPSKTEVRFRRQNFVHDAVRDALRRALGRSRPIPDFTREMKARPDARAAFAPGLGGLAAPVEPAPAGEFGVDESDLSPAFRLTPDLPAPAPQSLPFTVTAPPPALASPPPVQPTFWVPESSAGCEPVEEPPAPLDDAAELGRLRALAQIRDSFIVAASPTGLWLVDQHAAHERVLFEQISAQRLAGQVERQQLLLPMIVDLDPGRWARFAEIAEELSQAGFEAEPFGSRTVAVKAVPAGIPADGVQRLLDELLETPEAEARGWTLERIRTRISATIACHAAIKVNMRLEQEKMDWLLAALAQARYPMTCPHGRPVVLRYSLQEIQRAFKRIR